MVDELRVENKRRHWILESIIGPLANKTREELQHAELLMDNAGVARKAEGEEEKPPVEAPSAETEQPMPEMEPDDMLAKLAAKMAADLMVSLKDKLEGRVSEQEMTAALYSAMEAPPDDPEGEGEVTPPEEEQIMESKSQKSLDVEEQKAYAESFASMVKDMRDTAAYVQTMAEGQKQAADVQKSILDTVGALVKQVQALDEKVNGRPRSASQAAETIVDPTSEAGKALEAAIRKGTQNTRVWGGIPLADK